MAVTEELRIAEIPDVEVDPVTLDIIEGALKSARFEMDAVLFRSAMSPVIREQHDEFPMITDPRGRMVVGQFGAYINEMMESWDRGDLSGRRDPHVRPVQVLGLDLAHERLARARADLLRGRARRLVARSSVTRWTPAGRCRARCRRARRRSSRRGSSSRRSRSSSAARCRRTSSRLILNNVRLPEMNRADLFAIVAGCRAGEKRVIELCDRFGKDDVPRRAAGAARPHVRGDADADPGRHPRGAADLRGLHRRRRPRQRPVQDEADDLAGGRPRLLRLVGHRSAGPRTDQLLPLRGHVQDVHRDLPDHGQRSPDPLQRRLLSAAPRRHAGGEPAAARASRPRSAAARTRSRGCSTSSAARSASRRRS